MRAPGSNRNDRIHQWLGYVCAVLASWVAANLSMQIHSLHGTPVALNFIVAAALTYYFGLGTGLVAVFSTALVFYFQILLPQSASWLSAGALIRTAVILILGTLIALIMERQRLSSLELRLALGSLREQADTLAQAQQGSHSAAFIFNADDGTIRWAQGGATLLARPFEEVSTFDSLLALVEPQDRESLKRAADNVRHTTAPFHAEFRIALPTGETRWLEARGTASPEDSEWRGVILDVTNRKQAELSLLRSEKLAAIGRLSATVAHEINNPLEAVTNLLYLATSDKTLSEPTRTYLADAELELTRLASIARHTLTFARTRTNSGPTDVAAIAESIVAMFQTRCKSRGSQLILKTEPGLSVMLPGDELRQMLTNLLSNACDALIGFEGLIELELTSTEEVFLLIVRDTGIGVPPENMERIFDPFFTTKDDIGTGIGLWVTRELAEKNGGSIHVVSGELAAPFATIFTVEFPRSTAAV